MLLDQRDEVRRRIAGQCRLGKVRIGRDKVFCRAVDIGEIATPAAGNQNLFSQSLGMFKDRNPPAALARFDGAHQSRSAAAKNQRVIFMSGRFKS